MKYYINGKEVGAYEFCTRISNGRCYDFDSLPNSFQIPLLIDKEIFMGNDIYRVKTSIDEKKGLKKRIKSRRLVDKLTDLKFWFAIYILIVLLSMIICYSLASTVYSGTTLAIDLMLTPLYILCGIPIAIFAVIGLLWILVTIFC